MFDFQPSVTAKKKTGSSITTQKIKSQLRTGYCYLNGYLHSVGLKDLPLCTCGEPESVTHYIEDCEQYEEIREMLRSRLFYGTGSSEFSCKLFLGVKVKDELQEYREIINEVFDQYISNTTYM